MKFQDKICWFMLFKTQRLLDFGINPDLYFKKEDLTNIKKWSDNVSAKVWFIISNQYSQETGLEVLRCPFCVERMFKIGEYKMCSNCRYGDRHIKCNDVSSEYNKVRSICDYRGKNVAAEFSISYYNTIARKINEIP